MSLQMMSDEVLSFVKGDKSGSLKEHRNSEGRIHALRLVGDVHARFFGYIDRVWEYQYSLQVGDMGFDYSLLSILDPDRHKFVPGNHEHYSKLEEGVPHALMDFGWWEIPGWQSEEKSSLMGDKGIFFVRGAYSVDHRSRTEGVGVFSDKEELSQPKAYEALDLYAREKPKILVTHDCPQSITEEYIGSKHISESKSLTSQLFDRFLEVHRPLLWIFGHHHRDFDRTINGTRFICLPEIGVLDIPLHLKKDK